MFSSSKELLWLKKILGLLYYHINKWHLQKYCVGRCPINDHLYLLSWVLFCFKFSNNFIKTFKRFGNVYKYIITHLHFLFQCCFFWHVHVSTIYQLYYIGCLSPPPDRSQYECFLSWRPCVGWRYGTEAVKNPW